MLTIADPLGVVELEIVLGPNGPLVRVNASALELRTTGVLMLQCERFELEAREAIELRTNGDLTQSIAGDMTSRGRRRRALRGQGDAAACPTGRGPDLGT